jgi:hypothetical protein|tara:strand:- start:255 stop:452 length:198 start_codon:yes stop_codon:yes gene_type:complete
MTMDHQQYNVVDTFEEQTIPKRWKMKPFVEYIQWWRSFSMALQLHAMLFAWFYTIDLIGAMLWTI